jgi:Holliday junction DNA helicase RuvA
MLVAEDFIRLVGFASAEERDWFRLLTSVQGVGARVALGILSALTGDELHRAIMSGDKAMVARAQGVGPKLAQRIVNELKDRAGGIVLGGGSAPRRRPAARRAMRSRPCRISASSRPKRAALSPRRRTSWARARRLMRSCGWRSRRRRVRLRSSAEVTMVDMGVLVGSLRRFGLVGPPYEVLGPAAPGVRGEPRMRIRLLESGEETTYAVEQILVDPSED